MTNPEELIEASSGPSPVKRVRAQRATSSDGYTLIEVLIATFIVAVGAVVIAASLGTVAKASGDHRLLTTEETVVRSIGDLLVNPATAADPYATCATSYADPLTSLPAGVQTPTISVTSYWNGSSFVASCSPDDGIQQITISVTSSHGGVTESLTVLKSNLP